MDDEALNDADAFFQMAREFPMRTGIFTFGLPAFALLQLVNGYVHEGSLLYIGAFAALVVAYSVVLTQSHIAAYRCERLTGRWLRSE